MKDFHRSFDTDRIFNQMAAMEEHFKTPMLLIELDGRQIPLLDDDLTLPISSKDIVSRLFVLMHHFPTFG